jgi:peptidoglycan/xylan/chitin deacetylase (PgdA/CDA1 family)
VIPGQPAARGVLETIGMGSLVAALGGFVVGVSANPSTNSLLAIVLAAAGVVGGALLAMTGTPTRPRAAVGGAVALTCTWLLPQRDDVAAAVILAALFGAGVALSFEKRVWRSGVAVGVAELGVIVIARFTTTLDTVMLLVAVCVVMSTGARLARPTREQPQRLRALPVFAVTLAIVTLVFTAYLGAETPDASWFGGGTVHGPTTGNEVALTFDDGPNIGATMAIARILDEQHVKGTFFEVGKAVDQQPQITRALYRDGQIIGNHSYHHDQWRWLDPRYPELQRTQNAFKRAIGTCPTLYRPPHGDRTPFLASVVKNHHMHMVLWSASAGDWATNNPQLVAARILSHARPGAILLLHDGLDGNPAANRQVLVNALPLILDGLRAKGLRPVGLDVMLGYPAYQSC